ncbi:MAG: DUF4384 domain-containing protein [Proteobacteria bacterium]|nr:DUF4384 domain-containing protein [Pseudomonadota bacterium]
MKLNLALLACVFALSSVAQQSSITEADGYSCMGVDYSKKETEQLALQDAKRQAVEFSKSYIESTTEMENFNLKKDLVTAFAQAEVQVLNVVESQWDDPSTGDCYKIKIQAEVIPVTKAVARVASQAGFAEDPSAPLFVQLWASASELMEDQRLSIYLKANKPFFGRIIYTDAAGTKLQLLPNPYREDAYFQGGVVYEIPSGLDQFDLVVQAPFGQEKVSLYASTSPLGDLESTNLGPVLQVQTTDIARKTRGIKVVSRPKNTDLAPTPSVSEFAEASINLTTRPSS